MTLRGFGLILLASALLISGCAGQQQKERMAKDATATACPAKAVQEIQATQAFLASLTPGRTPTRALAKGPRAFKQVALIRPHEPTLHVYFYKAGLPGCPWVESENPNVPVIVEPFRGGMVLGYGRATLRTLQDQGWMLAVPKNNGWLGGRSYQTPVWAWQAYDYSYLPRDAY